jgi:hypothetical protein
MGRGTAAPDGTDGFAGATVGMRLFVGASAARGADASPQAAEERDEDEDSDARADADDQRFVLGDPGPDGFEFGGAFA